MNIRYNEEILKEALRVSKTWNELELSLGLKINTSRKHLKDVLGKFGLDTDHFIKNLNRKPINNKDLFTINNYPRLIIKRRIIRDNLIPYECECCGNKGEWLGVEMPLILEHKNGINNDHRLINLRFLCSNCDSIQPTYKNRNNNKKIKLDKKEEDKKIINETKEKELESIRNEILEANIDFSKKTWGVEVAKIINKSPQYSLKYIKNIFLTY